MSKLLLFDEEAREKLLSGIKTLERAVASTLGPLGSNVSIDKKWGSPSIIHDGIGVAKEIELDDEFENMGAQLVKEAASKTNDATGDGTTTSTILARHIVEEGLKRIADGANPMKVRKGILLAAEAVKEEIKKNAKELKSKEEIVQVATISAQDEEIGKLVGEIVWKYGKDGVISVEDGTGIEITSKATEGMEFDRGYISPYFSTNDKLETRIENPSILITTEKISSQSDILPVLEIALQETKNLVIIADDVEGEALGTLVINKLKGSLSPLAIKAPGFGDGRKELLEDIAILTGATLMTPETGKDYHKIAMSDFGKASVVWADKDASRIIDGKGDKDKIKQRISEIKTQIEKTESEFDREKLEERLARLSSGVVVINVGAKTEIEMGEKKERVKDALSATKASLQEGIVPGGATLLLKTSNLLKELGAEKDIKAGIDAVEYAVRQPFRVLMENSGLDYLENYQKVLKADVGWGIDVLDGQLKDMAEAGIIEPTKVITSAIDNAGAVGGTILTTKVLITDKPEKDNKEDD